MELRIKDHKLYLRSDRSSCNKFTANQFRLFLHSMAYILIHTLQKELLCTSLTDGGRYSYEEFRILYHYRWNGAKRKGHRSPKQGCPVLSG